MDMNHNFGIHLVCPWCKKGEVLADGSGKVTISVQCPRCRNYFLGDLDTMKTSKGQPQRRLGRIKSSRR